MDIDLKENGTVEVLMKEYIKESTTVVDELVYKNANIPTKQDLFTLQESTLLDTIKAEKFRHIIANLLYVC